MLSPCSSVAACEDEPLLTCGLLTLRSFICFSPFVGIIRIRFQESHVILVTPLSSAYSELLRKHFPKSLPSRPEKRDSMGRENAAHAAEPFGDGPLDENERRNVQFQRPFEYEQQHA